MGPSSSRLGWAAQLVSARGSSRVTRAGAKLEKVVFRVSGSIHFSKNTYVGPGPGWLSAPGFVLGGAISVLWGGVVGGRRGSSGWSSAPAFCWEAQFLYCGRESSAVIGGHRGGRQPPGLYWEGQFSVLRGGVVGGRQGSSGHGVFLHLPRRIQVINDLLPYTCMMITDDQR